MEKDKLYLEHIIEAISKIKQYTAGITLPEFKKSTLLQDAVVRELEVIGEAARHVSGVTKQKLANIPWPEILGMRNKLIHEYFGVDVEVVWETISRDLPLLKEKLEKR
ncbi:MAG TPA: DUF86 domain-containing protein [Candidatus Paceibacterota bacterium]